MAAPPSLVEVHTMYADERIADAWLRVTDAGALELATGTPPTNWTVLGRYGTSELAELRAAIARADEPPLAPSYGSPEQSPAPTVRVWRLARAGGDVKEVVERSHREGLVPPLDALHTAMYKLARGPDAVSVWRVRSGGRLNARTVRGEAADVPQLAGLIGSLYQRPRAFEPVAAGDAKPPAADDVLVDVRHLTGGRPTSSYAVTRDGRAWLEEDGRRRRVADLAPEELAGLREAIQHLRWDELPETLTGA